MFHPLSNKLSEMDSEITSLIASELERQEDGLELIASENYASIAVMEAQGSILTNKYAEGLPGKRYYGGCKVVDQIEDIARTRLNKLFGSKYCNVQPHSGSQANMGAYFSILKPGDTILGMNLAEGGHLTHGSPVNFSGKLFNVVSYGLNSKTEIIDYDNLQALANEHKPKAIVAGASAYSRTLDFERFREIADSVGAYLIVDMAHIAGLVAAGVHPSPIPHAHIVTSTTHKTLRGPRGGIILTNDEELFKKINFNIFPGIQGGPLEHVIAAKAVCFKEALSDEFKTYQENVVKNCKTLCEELKSSGAEIVSDGSDNHLLMLKTDYFNLTGKEAEQLLEKAHITCNKNMIPNDSRSPFVTSGIRLGTAALTTRGMGNSEFIQIAKLIINVLKNNNEETINITKENVTALCKKFPVYPKRS